MLIWSALMNICFGISVKTYTCDIISHVIWCNCEFNTSTFLGVVHVIIPDAIHAIYVVIGINARTAV